MKNESILTKEHLDSIEKYWEENKINVLFLVNGQCTGNALTSKLWSFSIYILSCPCSYLLQKPKLKCTDSACLLRPEYYFWVTFLAQQELAINGSYGALCPRLCGESPEVRTMRERSWKLLSNLVLPGMRFPKKMKPLTARIPCVCHPLRITEVFLRFFLNCYLKAHNLNLYQ